MDGDRWRHDRRGGRQTQKLFRRSNTMDGELAWSRTRERLQCTHGSDGKRKKEATGHREERKEGEGKLLDMMVHSGDAGGDDDEALRRR